MIFANAAGEDDQVDAIEHRDHRGDLLADGLTEHLYRQSCIGVRRSGFDQAPHVAADTGNSQQAGTTIHEVFEHRRIEVLLAHQVDQQAGIEIAAACAHDHAPGRRQTHAGVDRPASPDRRDAGAIAEMRDDHPARQIVAQLMHDRFAGEAVKPVALDPLRSKCTRDRQHARELGHSGVKARVETCDLRQSGKMCLRGADHRQRRRRVQRRKYCCRFQVLKDGVIDDAMATKLRAAMYDTMTDGVRRRQVRRFEKPLDAKQCFGFSGIGQGFRQQRLDRRGADAVQAELE